MMKIASKGLFMLKIDNIILPLDFTAEMLKKAAADRIKISAEQITKITLDRREYVKDSHSFKITVLCETDTDEKKLAMLFRKKSVTLFEEREYSVPEARLSHRPVVIGFGPAGIFASLVLAMSGARPIILERGDSTDERIMKVDIFSKSGVLDTESNIQFGEGGAGAFSDGKLKLGYKDSRKRKILEEFVKAGADESILYLDKPHIGSDVLHKVIVSIREKIISLGAEIHFNAKLTELLTHDNSICGVKYIQNGKEFEIDTSSVVLATGHSARDTYRYLHSIGIEMSPKGFGVGVRIEHPQSLINTLEYGDASLAQTLGAADYKLVEHLENGRSIYTFCMCPGGYVVPAASNTGGICTNGMSEFNRNSPNANTALLISVTPNDFNSNSPMAGIEFQEKIEQRAFAVAGGNYSAPTIRLEDFLNRRSSEALGAITPTYTPSTVLASPDSYLPDFICESLRIGIRQMCNWKKGYYCADAVLTGPETRTTAPIKIKRDENCNSSLSGLYPAGEGAGYAGGIISSAVDGMICAEKIIGGKK